MIFAVPNLTPALPEIFVLIMASLILVVDLFLSGKNRFVSYALTQLTLLGAAWITVSTSGQDVVHTFNGMFVDDVMADVLKLMTYISVSAMLVYSRSYTSHCHN
ncbi:MAG: NADH:ubiquinone oxidoreductase subunit N, partial [Hydrogenophilales bacterium CG18_big_fil_WC_8_21_14_2_50_58_12]